MVWKSWGGRLLSAVVSVLLLAASPSLLCSGADDVAVRLSEAPRRISRSSSAVFAFQVLLLQSGGVPCVGCAVTCKVSIAVPPLPVPQYCLQL